jgi:hypothetical protein
VVVEEGLDVADDDLEDSDFEANNEETEQEEEDSDDLEADAAIDEDDDAAVDDSEEEEEAEPAAAVAKKRSEPARAESVVVHSPAAKEAQRQRLASDVEAFLKRGGSIESVPQDVRADPPKKPESNYGRGSI